MDVQIAYIAVIQSNSVYMVYHTHFGVASISTNGIEVSNHCAHQTTFVWCCLQSINTKVNKCAINKYEQKPLAYLSRIKNKYLVLLVFRTQQVPHFYYCHSLPWIGLISLFLLYFWCIIIHCLGFFKLKTIEFTWLPINNR